MRFRLALIRCCCSCTSVALLATAIVLIVIYCVADEPEGLHLYVAVACIASIFAIVFFGHFFYLPGQRLPPGSIGWPILGQTLSIKKGMADHSSIRQMIKKYGPIFKTHFLFAPAIVLSGVEGMKAFTNPDNVERASKDNGNIDSFKKPYYTKSGGKWTFWQNIRFAIDCDTATPWFGPCIGPRIFPFVSTPEHDRRRPPFWRATSKESIEKLIWPRILHSCKRHLPGWAAKSTLCVQEEVCVIVFEAITNYVHDGVPESEVGLLRTSILHILAAVGSLPFSPEQKNARAGSDAYLTFLKQRLEKCKEQRSQAPPQTLMQLLLQDGTLSEDIILTEMLHAVFVATGGITCWVVNALMELCWHPNDMKELVAEATQGDFNFESDFANLWSGYPSATCVTLETKRRYVCSNTQLFGYAVRTFEVNGYRVPKGWWVIASARATLHDAKLWPEPDEWRPGRMKELPGGFCPFATQWQGDYKYGFCPQGAGEWEEVKTRRCPAEEMSTLSIKFILLEVLASYQVEMLEGQDLSLDLKHPLPTPKDGLMVRVTARQPGKSELRQAADDAGQDKLDLVTHLPGHPVVVGK